jgi:hypothetical protein
MSGAEIHSYRLKAETRDGATRTVLVITTTVPVPPLTHIDRDVLATAERHIVKLHADKGVKIDEVRFQNGQAADAT